MIFRYDKEGLNVELHRMRGIDINAMGDEDYPERKDEDIEQHALSVTFV